LFNFQKENQTEWAIIFLCDSPLPKYKKHSDHLNLEFIFVQEVPLQSCAYFQSRAIFSPENSLTKENLTVGKYQTMGCNINFKLQEMLQRVSKLKQAIVDTVMNPPIS